LYDFNKPIGIGTVLSADDQNSVGNFVETVHKNGAAGSQIVNDKPVVNDFLANIDRTAELL